MITQANIPASETHTKPGLVISLDFELRWGVRDIPNQQHFRDQILAVREAVPAMLELFRRYEVHATWATVGMLLFDDKKTLMRSLPDVRPSYENSWLSPYSDLDQVGANEKSDPLHFGRSLAGQICETPGQELSSHTFSHYYCLEAGQTVDQFQFDLHASIETNRAFTGYAPKSIVFPRNQCSAAHISVCNELGIGVYRGTESHWAYTAGDTVGFNRLPKRITRLADSYLPVTGSQPVRMRKEQGVWNVPSSRFLRPTKGGFAGKLRLWRVVDAMRRSLSQGQGFHLWWHPHNFGGDLAANVESLESVLFEFSRFREKWGAASYTMSEYAGLTCP